jgi:hypothetical protein
MKEKKAKCLPKTVEEFDNSLTRNDENFILSSTTGKLRVLSYDVLKKDMSGWSKTSTFDVLTKEKIPLVSRRLYVCYKDTSDNTTAVYIVRILTHIGKK